MFTVFSWRRSHLTRKHADIVKGLLTLMFASVQYTAAIFPAEAQAQRRLPRQCPRRRLGLEPEFKPDFTFQSLFTMQY